MASTEERKVKIIMDGSQATASMKQMKAAIALLNKQLQKLPAGSKEFINKSKELNGVRDKYKKVTAEVYGLGAAQSRLKSIVKGVSIGSLLAAGAEMAIGALKRLASSSIDFARSMSDAYSDVRKTTGLTQQGVKELSEELRKLNTRTSELDLLKTAEIGGRFNVAQKDLKEFVKQTDRATVALGDEFAGGVEEITKKFAKMQSMFKEVRNLKISDSIKHTGSAINELGATTKASAPNIADFVTRVGALPDALKPSIQDTMALGAMFEEVGIQSEVSSRAFSIFINKAAANTEEFALVMGKSNKEIREMINTDPAKFFVEFAKSMDGLPATETATILKELGLNADGVKKVIGALSSQTERFGEIQKTANDSFAAGSSLMNEFNIKNENFAATWAKITKKIEGGFMRLISGPITRFAKNLGWLVEEEEDLVLALRNTQAAMNDEMSVIDSANFTQEERAKAINNINEKYGEYLPNLLSEKASIEDIKTAQEEANKAFENKILLMAFEEELAANIKKQADAAGGLFYSKQSLAILKERQKYENEGKTPAQLKVEREQAEAMVTLNESRLAAAKEESKELRKRQEGIRDLLDLTKELNEEADGDGPKNGFKGIPNSIKAIREQISKLKEEQANSTDFMEWGKIEDEIKYLQAQIEEIQGIKMFPDRQEVEMALAEIKARMEQFNKEIGKDDDPDGIHSAILDEYLIKMQAEDDFHEMATRLRKEREKAGIDAAITMAEAIANIALDRWDFQLRKENDMKVDALEIWKEKELSVEGLSEEKRMAIEAKYERKRAQLRIEQFENERRVALTQVAINTAVAISKGFAEAGPVGGVPLMIFALAQGAAQAAMIMSQPTPQYAKGGRTPVTGEQDGKTYNSRNVGSFAGGGVYSEPSYGLVGEQGSELVIPNWMYKAPALANTMGALESMIYTRQFNSGGSTSGSTAPIQQGGMDTTALESKLDMMIQLQKSLLVKEGNKRVTFVKEDFDKFNDLLDFTNEQSALFG